MESLSCWSIFKKKLQSNLWDTSPQEFLSWRYFTEVRFRLTSSEAPVHCIEESPFWRFISCRTFSSEIPFVKIYFKEVMFELTYGKVVGHFLQEIPFVKIYFKEVMFELTYGKVAGHFLQEIPFVKIYFKALMFKLTYGKVAGHLTWESISWRSMLMKMRLTCRKD